MKAYFELEDNLGLQGRWYLNRLCDRTGIQLDSREFCYGRPVELGPPIKAKSWKEGDPVAAQPPLKILLDPARFGSPLDFTFTNADMPVATARIAGILASIAPNDIQRIPVLVESRGESYEIINVVRKVDCINKELSEIQWFKSGNDVRPDLAGQPEMVSKLVVDPSRIGNHHMLRIDGWEIAIIVSDVIKDAFQRESVTGVKFRQVSP